MIYLKNPETGEIQKFLSINSAGASYTDWEDITNNAEEVETFETSEVLAGLGYEIESFPDGITLEYALVLEQRRGMIEIVMKERDRLVENGIISISLPKNNVWHTKIDEKTRGEVAQKLLLAQGQSNKQPFKDWVGEFEEVYVGEAELKEYLLTSCEIVDSIDKICRDMGKKIEALQTQDDINNFVFGEEFASIAPIRESLGLFAERNVPTNNSTDFIDMKLA